MSENCELLTEQTNAESSALDKMSALEIVSLMSREDTRVVDTVRAALPAVASLVEALVSHMKRGGRLFYIGAGTSGRLGTLDAAECPPTFGTDPEMVQAVMAGGSTALTQAVEQAEDSVQDGARELELRGLTANDFVIGISASGTTPFVVGAVRRAAELGAGTGAIFCNPGTALGKVAEHSIVLPVGAEILTGSTRLKAGTATKMVLNMISTASMVRLGHCLGNLMIDVKANNAKLVGRKVRILAEAARISNRRAEEILDSVAGDMRKALKLAQAEAKSQR